MIGQSVCLIAGLLKMLRMNLQESVIKDRSRAMVIFMYQTLDLFTCVCIVPT